MKIVNLIILVGALSIMGCTEEKNHKSTLNQSQSAKCETPEQAKSEECKDLVKNITGDGSLLK